MRRLYDFLFLIGLGTLLRELTDVMSSTVEEAVKEDTIIGIGSLFAIATVFIVAYRRHREDVNELLADVEKRKAIPGVTEDEWAPLLFESRKPWKWRKKLIYLAISLIANLVSLGSIVFLSRVFPDYFLLGSTSHPNAISIQLAIFFVTAFILRYAWKEYEESLASLEFAENLKAANEGRWFSSPEELDDDDRLNVLKDPTDLALEQFSDELPEALFKSVTKGFTKS